MSDETQPETPPAAEAPAAAVPQTPRPKKQPKMVEAKEQFVPPVLQRTLDEIEAGKAALVRHAELAANRALAEAQEAPPAPIMIQRDNSLVPGFQTPGQPVAQ